jgi:hypothetical protein
LESDTIITVMADLRNSGIQNSDGTINVGLANNNPGDIKYDGTQWLGEVGNNGTFVTFSDTTWGLRAIGVDLTTKINKDGLNTITLIVTAYAPASDNNNVPAYISSVASDTGFDPNAILTADPATLSALIRAIVNHEIGDTLSSQYVSDADIATGISMMTGISPLAQAAVIAVQADPGSAVVVAALIYWVIFNMVKGWKAR